MTSERILAASAVAQVAVLVIAAVYAKRQADEARALREAQARPFVVIDVEIDGQKIFLAIANLGKTLARDVRFNFKPPLASSLDTLPERQAIAESKLFTDGIPSLAPGSRVVPLFDYGPRRRNHGGLPDTYSVGITYAGEPYEMYFHDSTVIDLGIYWDLAHRSDATPSANG